MIPASPPSTTHQGATHSAVSPAYRHRAAAPGSSTSTAPSAAPSPSAPDDELPERSFSSGADDSLTFSSSGSILYRPRKSDSSFASSFEALSITSSVAALAGPPSVPKSSSPNNPSAADLPPSPTCAGSPLAPQHARALPDRAERQQQPTPTKSSPSAGLLNPAAPTFQARLLSARKEVGSLSNSFAAISRNGKDANGDLTQRAKAAMSMLGLKAIPSLHGTSLLPYSRNPSGSDAFRFTVDGGEEGFEPIVDEEIEYFASHRAVPLPLPGNARYTPTGRHVLAQQRIASAPAGRLGASSRRGAGSSRGSVTAPAQTSQTASTFSSDAPSPILTAASIVEQHQRYMLQQARQQAEEGAFAMQAYLAHQAQQVQLSQAQQAPFSPDLLPPMSPQFPYSFGGAYASTHATPSLAPPMSHNPGPYPIQNSPSSATSASVYGDIPFQRRPSIVIGPTGGVSFVDSSTLLQLAMHPGLEASQPGGSSGPSSRVTSYGTAPAGDSSVELGATSANERAPSDDLELAACSASTSSRHRLTRAEQLDRRRDRGRSHRPTLSDATLTAQTYLEQGRRKSAMASFPPPGDMRRSSSGPRHVSSHAALRHSAASTSRRASVDENVAPGALSSAAPYRPPMMRRSSSRLSAEPTAASSREPSARGLSEVEMLASSRSHRQHPTAQLHYEEFEPAAAVPVVQLEPPTPKLSRTAGRPAAAPMAQSRSTSSATTTSGLPRVPSPSAESGSSEATVTPGDGQDPLPVAGVRKSRWKRRSRKVGEASGASMSVFGP